MAPPNPLKRLRTLPSNISYFAASYCPRNVYQSIALRYILTPFHPLQPKIKHAYATREKGVLWWSVLHGQLTSEKRRTRSVFVRKSRQAVLDALEERGLDAQGRKKIVEEPVKREERDTKEKSITSSSPPTSGPSGIVGTLELYLQHPILEASQEEIKKQAGSIIDFILSGKANRSQETWRKPKKQGRETSSTDFPQASTNRDHARRQTGPAGGEARKQ